MLEVLVKAPLRVHYVNYCTRGVVERLIQHEAKQYGAVL